MYEVLAPVIFPRFEVENVTEMARKKRKKVLKPSGAPAALVFGVLSVGTCGLFGPFAWYLGGRAVRRIDGGQAEPNDRAVAQAGRWLGILATIALFVPCLFLMAFFPANVIAEAQKRGAPMPDWLKAPLEQTTDSTPQAKQEKSK